MSIYLCIKCQAWFDTHGELKTHICGRASNVIKDKPSIKKEPVNEQAETTIDVEQPIIPIPETTEIITETKQEEVPDFSEGVTAQVPKTREELLAEAKSLGFDMRTFRNKDENFIQQKIEEKLKEDK